MLNKLYAVLQKITPLLVVVFIAYFLYINIGQQVGLRTGSYYGGVAYDGAMKVSNLAAPMAMSESAVGSRDMMVDPYYPTGQSTDLSPTDRKTVKNANVSAQVDDVSGSIQQLSSQAEQLGGFVVNSNLNQPTEAASGNLTVRIPSDQLDGYLQFIHDRSVKVVNENISGYDITDQYQDLQKRLETLQRSKQRLDALYEDASTVEEILKVQNSLLDLQRQIDSVTGQLEYTENVSNSSLVSMYLSTDDMALPYSPDEAWRPAVVFKTAVRSLVRNTRNFGSFLIWLAVYSPAIIVGLIILLVGRRYLMKQSRSQVQRPMK